MSNESMKGKVCILTGGAGFLGVGYAKSLAEAGAQVIVWDSVGQDVIDERLKPLVDLRVSGVSVDISNEDAVKKAVEEVLKKHGRVDVLINNAAMNPAVGSEESKKQFVPIEEYPVELWRKELDINLTGMFICIKAVVPVMKAQKGGVVVNVASEVSTIAHDHRVYNQPGKYKSPAYVTTKTGVLGLTRSTAAQLGQYNIRVNALSIGGVFNEKMPGDFVKRFGDTNMFGRMANAGEYNEVMVFLASNASSFMTGANLVIDGGKSSW